MEIKKEHTITATLLAPIMTLIPFAYRAIKNPSIISPESYHYAQLLNIKNTIITATLYPTIIITIAIILLQTILRKNKETEETIFFTTIITALSSTTITLAGTINTYPIIILLSLLTIIAWEKKPITSIIPLWPLIIIDTPSFYATTLMLIAISTLKKQQQKTTTIIAAASIIYGIITQTIIGPTYSYIAPTGLKDLILELGARKGYQLTIIVLAIIGGIKNWPGRKASITAIIITGTTILSYFDYSLRYLLLPIITYLAAKGIIYLKNRVWSINDLKNASLFIIILSLMFSIIITINMQIKEKPTKELIEASEFLKGAPSDGKILTTRDNSIIINSLTGKEATITHERKKLFKQEDKGTDTANKIYYERNFEEAMKQIKENNIKYILIDKEMINGEVWDEEEQGILFLIKYNNKFIKIYENQGTKIYRVDY